MAELTPFLEQTNVYNTMDLTYPLYVSSGGNWIVSPPNRFATGMTVPLFHCPSDPAQSVSSGYGLTEFGPTNYCANTGSGLNGGSPYDTDGPFYANSRIRLTDILDGTSNTVLMSESLLGDGPESASGPIPGHYSRVYGFLYSGALSDSARGSPQAWNLSNRRGFQWVSGEYRCTSYNHYYPPNHKSWDCFTYIPSGPPERLYTATAWRAARSAHEGGVNICLGDGSVRFIRETIDIAIWRALATRNGSEVFGEF